MGLLCCPNFYVTWYHFRSLVLCRSLCCPNFSVTWSHFRSVWVSMLSEFLCHLESLPFCADLYVVRFSCHLISLPFCMGLYVVRVSMSLGLISVLFGSLCCPRFYVTWSHTLLPPPPPPPHVIRLRLLQPWEI